MTRLAILAVGLTSILPIYGQQQSPPTARHQNSSQNTKSPDQRTSSPIAPAGITVIDKQTSTTQADRSSGHPQSYLARLFSPENLPNIALVVAGFAGIIVAICTLSVLRRQTKATEQSAEAALLNAQAIINSERAWITVMPYRWSPEFFPRWEPGDPIPKGDMGTWPIAHLFPAQIKCFGKTPARITGIAVRYIRTRTNPSQWPAEPDYGDLSVEDIVLVPQDEIAATAKLSPDNGVLTKAQIDAIQKREEFLFAYGIVKYKDVHQCEREARFGYVYSTPEDYHLLKDGSIQVISFDKAVFRRGGPPAYNSAQ
jgi:hypothetical protein